MTVGPLRKLSPADYARLVGAMASNIASRSGANSARRNCGSLLQSLDSGKIGTLTIPFEAGANEGGFRIGM